MAELYFYKYNNAYNKIVRKKDTFADYQQYQIGSALQNINFNPNDGITAEHIINWNNDIPDYMIVGDGGEIISRWFVVEAQRTRGGQLRLSLLRDVLADNYDAVLNSKCFVQKGYVPNSSPLIFNNENMGFNQIKRGETLLKNNLGTPWIVLYLSRYHTNDSGDYAYNEYTGEFIDEAGQTTADYELNSLEEYKYYQYSINAYEYVLDNDIVFHSIVQKLRSSSETEYLVSNNDIEANGKNTSFVKFDFDSNYPIWTGSNWTPVANLSLEETTEIWNTLMAIYKNGDSSTVNNLPVNTYTGLGSQEGAALLSSESGKTIRVDGKVYRIVVNTESEYQTGNSADVSPASSLGISMAKELLTDFGVSTTGRDMDLRVRWGYYSYNTKITFVETQLASNGIKYDIKYNGAVTTDAPYEILVTPYKDVLFTDGAAPFQHSGDIALQWFQDIANRYNGAGWVYDIQLVPFVPNQFDFTNITNLDKVYCYSEDAEHNQTNLSVAFKIPNASFSLRYDMTLDTVDNDNKISNETQLYRICSPNGVGEYKFSPAKNGGFTGFEVDCTLIPFNPYIKINPVFGNLYGGDYNDYRGLICGGDFSLPILSNSWETYQLNNKYYQDIFNRKIETQEYNNKWQLASNIAGAVSGAAGGAAMGGMIGGPIGAIAGGLLSATGGITDVIAGQAMFREGIDYQKDMFGYELGTIKARAESLTRTTAYNINNKYFPYVEYYSCTDKERQALQDKIKYNGMTVGVIGTLSEYLNPSETSFFQGQLIEIDITDDAHTAHEIARELQEGRRFEH